MLLQELAQFVQQPFTIQARVQDEMEDGQVVQPAHFGILQAVLFPPEYSAEFFAHAGFDCEPPGAVVLANHGISVPAPKIPVVVPVEHLLPIDKAQQGCGVAVGTVVIRLLSVLPVQFHSAGLLSVHSVQLHPRKTGFLLLKGRLAPVQGFLQHFVFLQHEGKKLAREKPVLMYLVMLHKNASFEELYEANR